jgi:hypothetical protein
MHAGCPPQVQPASAEQPSASAPHITHWPPPVPQSFGSFPGLQALPSQQPAHIVGSHTHVMFEHSWPGEHAGPPPQVQSPLVLHPSAYCAQEVHCWPGAPQVVALKVWHVPSTAQQPPGHDVAVHAQEPLEQT